MGISQFHSSQTGMAVIMAMKKTKEIARTTAPIIFVRICIVLLLFSCCFVDRTSLIATGI